MLHTFKKIEVCIKPLIKLWYKPYREFGVSLQSWLDGYLACAKNTMELLHSFSAIKKLSLKLNTALPASAACERLFSFAGLLFTAKQSQIDSVNLENQLLLKLNKRFQKWSVTGMLVCLRV